MATFKQKKYFIISALFHLAVLLLLVLGFDFTAPLLVVENTDKHDVISAVVLGDTAKSKILPTVVNKPLPTPKPEKIEPKPLPKPEVKVEAKPEPKPIEPPKQEKAIALKPPVKKPIKTPPKDIFGKDLLADLEKFKNKATKKKKQTQKDLKSHFEKTLHEQAEKSMRRNLLNEDIKLKGTEARDSQGIINKYQALIQQAISEHWVIPPLANKKLSSVLMIHLAPGGTVLDVQIAKSSGDPALDSSARAAVYKASPLPVPSKPEEFEMFRQFTLKAKPENILDGSPIG